MGAKGLVCAKALAHAGTLAQNLVMKGFQMKLADNFLKLMAPGQQPPDDEYFISLIGESSAPDILLTDGGRYTDAFILGLLPGGVLIHHLKG